MSTSKIRKSTAPKAVTLDPSKIVGEVEAAAKAYVAAVEDMRARTVGAAYATYHAAEAGMIGGKGDAVVWAKAEDYGLLFGGVTSQTITLWRRLGKALTVGIAADSETFQHLAFKHGSAAFDSSVGKAIEDPKATPASIRKALAVTRLPNGKRRPKAGTAAATVAATTPDAAAGAAAVAAVADPMARVDVALGILSDTLKHDWTAEDWAKIEDKITAIVTREVTLLAARSKAATVAPITAKATPATVKARTRTARKSA